VQALAGALASMLRAVTGITSKSLRAWMTGLPGDPYGMNQASCDLGRLARNGLITPIPHRNLSSLTPEACDSPSSAPRSTTGCCVRSWPVTSPKLRPLPGKPSAPSTARPPCPSRQPACQPPPDPPRKLQPDPKLRTDVKVLPTKRGYQLSADKRG